MTQTRIYLPLDARGVRRLSEDRAVGAGPVRAFAVTDRVERSLPSGDEEEWEYAALTDAVDAATELRVDGRSKRVVAAADVDPSLVSPGSGGALSAIQVSEPVPLSRIVSFHVDESPGDEGVDDLLWYDATELDEVLHQL